MQQPASLATTPLGRQFRGRRETKQFVRNIIDINELKFFEAFLSLRDESKIQDSKGFEDNVSRLSIRKLKIFSHFKL